MWQSLKSKILTKSFIFYCAIIFGIGLRLIQFGQIPVGTYWDETAILIDATTVAETGHDMHRNSWLQAIFPSYGDYKLPVYIWLSSLVVKVIGSHEIAVRLPSLVAGLGTIVLAAALAGELAKYWPRKQRLVFQLAAASVVSLSYWAILFSRVGFEGHLAQLWLGISFLLLLKSKQKAIYWPLAGLFGALALFTYYATRFIWPALWLLMLLPILYQMISKSNQRRSLVTSQLLPAVLSFAIFSLSLLVMIRSPLYPASELFRLSSDSILNQAPFVAQANLAQQIEGPTLIGRVVLHRHIFQAQALLNHLSAHFSLDYLFFHGDANLRHGTSLHGLFPVFFLPFLLLGIVSLFRHHKKVFIFLIFWWVIGLIPASVPYEVPHSLRSLNSLLPLSLIFAYGCSVLFLSVNRTAKIVLKILIVGVGFELVAFSYFLFTTYPKLSASEWQAGYKQLAQHAIQHQADVNNLWINSGDGRFYLWLLAYGNLSTQEIQKLNWQNYQLATIDNINLQDFVYSYEDLPNTPFALAGRRKEILSNLAILKLTPQVVVPIYDANQQEQFIVTYFNLNQERAIDVTK